MTKSTSRIRLLGDLIGDLLKKGRLIRWIRSYAPDYLLRTRQPWLCFDAIDHLASMPLQGKRVFEYGSGGSTLFWLSKGAACVSIEHDARWFDKLRSLLPRDAAVDYRLIEPDYVPETERPCDVDPADPDAYLSADFAVHPCSYKRYVTQIDSYADGTFDVVLVDGRARPSCIKHSAPKTKIGGVLIVDNAENDYYFEKTGPFLTGFTRMTFQGALPANRVLTRTDFYRRTA